MVRNPTAKQLEVLAVIRAFIGANGYPPSIREIGARVHLTSSSSVLEHLKNLQRLRLIRRDPTKPRAIVLLDSGGCPNCGAVVPSVKVPILDLDALAL